MIRRTQRILILTGLALSLCGGAALGAGHQIKQVTPEIQQALDGRKARFSRLQAVKQQGAIGENNQGYVEVLQPSPDARQLADAENADRRVIYEAIVQQHNLGPEGLAQVQYAFADVRRDKANPGDMIQSATGEWTKK